ncbi:YccV-like-domain-containing protein [Cucurbitaria berberidis CBS 394.84]|uniref:YccV-like-domain-containing protein n=1 Tax=Cucurbitaria berberidis CBS 394.84 TaxID=1168544 RepID=A0A9P4L6P8_9PLEO|nr:YccV-like-domain-containing protein [Cucurbitaria berberidis CBS 394.84]KAF1844040.1 YccV-like-domain-containing protein [Cucurbitaria berberidis CBS 394.84]
MDATTTRPSFTDLPTEILESIFLHLDPHSLISVSQTNKLVNQLTADAPIIWRHLCYTRFKTWDSRHNIASKFSGPLSDVDWRSLFISKITIERRTRELLHAIVATQQERIRRINEIADFGYDAKETLLTECACPDDAEDVLARRYYANAVLERIHREIAINVWKDLHHGKHVPIERALGAYDVFARVGEDVDNHVVSEDIDRYATGVLEEYPDFGDLSPRIKASTLATYLRDQGFEGVPDTSYRALCNSFIGLVLRSPTHESLPLISVAIYCAVARRLGLDARPCGFLFHVYTLVYAPKNYTLDGKYKPTSSEELDHMYLDPFRSSSEVQQGDLQRVLRDMGVPTTEHATFLSDTTTREMVLRTARNIMNSVQTIRQTEAGVRGIQASWLHAYPDMDNAFYATIWAMLLLGPNDDASNLSSTTTRRRQYLPYLLEHFQTHFPWDVTLLSRYVVPMFSGQPEGHRLLQFVQSMRHADALKKPVLHRTDRTVNVNFKVGQLFQHKRYSYEGVITGWDVACDAGEEWIENMGVDRLPNGRNQAFYHVLVCDKSVRYVAEENIQPVEPNTRPSEAILKLAGRHFKRWDDADHCFVNNVRDEYPDD